MLKKSISVFTLIFALISGAFTVSINAESFVKGVHQQEQTDKMTGSKMSGKKKKKKRKSKKSHGKMMNKMSSDKMSGDKMTDDKMSKP